MKILATDMDGTFLDHLGAYDKARLDNLLDACEAKDYVFTVASGRALLALEELFDGFVDRIVHREKMREELGRILKLHSRK